MLGIISSPFLFFLDFKHKDMKKYITGIGISREKLNLCFIQQEKVL
ncbi:hypothetical protein Barb6XT_03161 [Bacteroidales bacterium Barb6XT]|nr:hypothetical protein Barb6XT_03161 [Bacteroidales bacterium Barb6XT]